ncbi:MAG: hypothetical protein FWC55_04015 [Firmicutes bacterium]|nr:hypothetical protein [Bacillota bacterium]
MDRQIIRDLAGRYANIANSDKNRERVTLYKAVNDLHMIRPVILTNEIPWHEMNVDGELDLRCEDAKMRELEWFFRTKLFEQKHFPCDNYLRPYYPVYKDGNFGRLSMPIDETRLPQSEGGYIFSHEYHDILQNEEDLEKLVWTPGYYNRENTMRRLEFAAEAIGDILPVQVVGTEYGTNNNLWDQVAEYRGVANLLNDLIERPEFMHKIARKLTDAYIRSIREAVKYNLFAAELPELHCSPGFTNDLPPIADYDHIEPKNVWGRGVAQIFGNVSPAMQEEFDTQYQLEALAPFGLVYYGCCERLDNKLRLLMKMKNLRKISITPWSDIDVAAEILENRYEMAVKHNPAYVSTAFDEETIRGEFDRTWRAAKRNGCSFDVVLKDISTVAGKPGHLFKWAEVAAEYANNY